jgi:predicted nucleic acid-binding protein
VLAIVDTGPLYAAVDTNDKNHRRSREVLERGDLELVIPTLVVTEVVYLIGERLGATIEAEFVRGLASIEVEPPTNEDWPAIATLVERYAGFPLGTVDASVAVLADRLDADLIITLDHRHFRAIRSARQRPYRLLPE